ncbi:N-acetylmuramoyl-L-alanine amidase family protein [Paenisporosarcina cavernae]|uniref:N-acetylmuramoyl-L-alanine amidase n=1 Tax=Paenisporosarcina cavernae TaxID=2320858 RepID=A0A385YX88_9BACL|nr:N-acetylmuramoyl-L-alanine amidase [Paenisporosarcina cavernae]AYC30122.1 N-acetylmuramoyl-L-alanine amidase [Paenisporosarcina cavernae]
MLKIALDAGHGAQTPGKRTPDGRMREFQFNEAVAVELKKRWMKKGWLVVFTHDKTKDVSLHERVELANRMKVDLFVSIHANAFGSGWNDANGIETFTCTHAQPTSRAIAQAIQLSLSKRTGRKNRGVKEADFTVLKRTFMPAVLVECGFMTNKEEAALLQSTAYRQLCAEAIGIGVEEYFQQ